MAQDPSTIGRYKVLRRLGGGGMGVVYLAVDAVLKRQVAIKLVRGSFAEHEHAMLRFQREAEVSARLNHPNVIVVYDVGDEPGFGPFIAMEFVAGSDLAEMIRDRRLDEEGCLQVLVQAARALEAAHDAGIVHRDIKPANLLVSAEGRVKLLDFGIARGDDSTLTATGMFLGTPGFMAPEQIKGDDASAATDRYAFSVLALELLSGRRPFNADSTPALLYKIVHEPPDIAAELAPALRRVFERALAKDPAVRFADLRSFLLALVDAATLAESRRATLRALIGTSDTVDLDRTHVSDASTVGATVATAARPRQKAVLREGVSGRSIGRVLAGAGVVAGAGIGVALWLARHDEGPKPTPAAPAVVQATAAPQRAAVASPAVLAAPAASPTAPSVAVAPATPLAAAGAPTATPVAAAAAPSDAPVAAAVAPTASPRAVVAVAPVEPTAAPARRASVPDALAPVAAPTGARRAPQPTAIAKRTKRDGNAAAPARAAAPAPASPPAAQAAPVWGEIRSEGAQRTD